MKALVSGRPKRFQGVQTRLGTVVDLKRELMQPFLIRVMVDRVDADLHGVAVDLTTQTSHTFRCVAQLIEILRREAGATDEAATGSREPPATTSA